MSERSKEYYLGSDGSIEYYPDAYAVEENKIALAEGLEQYIMEQQHTIEASFMKIGAALIKFEEEELYLARGLPTMKVWLEGAEFSFSYAHATRLMRIVRDLVPIIGDKHKEIPVSTMKELLPMLADGSTPEQINEAVDEVTGLTTRDAKRRIRELRGVEERAAPTIFRAKVRTGETYHYVTVTRTGEDGDSYTLTEKPLRIKPKDFALFIELAFGDAFIEYE